MPVAVLGLPVFSGTQNEVLEVISGWIEAPARVPHRIVTLNAEMAQMALGDVRLASSIAMAELILPDGVGVIWAAKHQGTLLPGRIAGVDLTESLARAAVEQGWSIFLLGAEPGVADETANRLTARFGPFRVAGTHHGFFESDEEQDIIQAITESRPDILLVALGVPRQELWLADHSAQLGIPCMMGVGGTFDVLSGRVARAPRWVRLLGMEWAYRLLSDPRRWKRGLRLPAFIWSVLHNRHIPGGAGIE